MVVDELFDENSFAGWDVHPWNGSHWPDCRCCADSISCQEVHVQMPRSKVNSIESCRILTKSSERIIHVGVAKNIDGGFSEQLLGQH